MNQGLKYIKGKHKLSVNLKKIAFMNVVYFIFLRDRE